jgi:hypothetical protein
MAVTRQRAAFQNRPLRPAPSERLPSRRGSLARVLRRATCISRTRCDRPRAYDQPSRVDDRPLTNPDVLPDQPGLFQNNVDNGQLWRYRSHGAGLLEKRGQHAADNASTVGLGGVAPPAMWLRSPTPSIPSFPLAARSSLCQALGSKLSQGSSGSCRGRSNRSSGSSVGRMHDRWGVAFFPRPQDGHARSGAHRGFSHRGPVGPVLGSVEIGRRVTGRRRPHEKRRVIPDRGEREKTALAQWPARRRRQSLLSPTSSSSPRRRAIEKSNLSIANGGGFLIGGRGNFPAAEMQSWTSWDAPDPRRAEKKC